MKRGLLFFSALLCLCGQMLQAQSKVALIDEAKESIVRIFAFNMPFYFDETTFNLGTGYVVGDGNLVITSYQVVKDMNGVVFYSQDESKSYYGAVIWSNPITDVAIIKAIDCTLKPLEFADPETVHAGDETLIFGYAGDDQITGSIMVTWGLISSNAKDSTIQTSATITPASLGGPAINMEGKVIGTVHARTSGFSFQEPSIIKNVKFSKDAVDFAKTDNSSNYTYFGATSFDAYKKICDGAIQGYKAAGMEDLAAKDAINAKIYYSITEALSFDPNYIEAMYFRTAYSLVQARSSCLKNNEEDAKSLFLKFKGEIPDIDSRAKTINPNLLAMNSSFYNLRKQAVLPEMNCAETNASWYNFVEASHNRQNRFAEFNNYLMTGKTPVLLRQAVGGRLSPSQGGGSGSKMGGDEQNSLFFMASINKIKPVRFSVCFPFGFGDYNKNFGLSVGNAGSSKSKSVVFCKYQFSVNLIQDLSEDATYKYRRYVVPGFDLGIQANIVKMLRFNPKPFITVAYNPTFYQNSSVIDSIGSFSEWSFANGSFNFGIDLDLWVTSSFAMSLSYQYTTSFTSIIPSLYKEEEWLKDISIYSIFKIGILF
jgi:hypothetical protein